MVQTPVLYTALSRATNPDDNVLIERFDAALLDTIAGSDKMEAMKEEFKEMEKRRKVTEVWARPLLAKFEELYTSHASV